MNVIGRQESLYLDLMRSLAALAVVFDHAAGVFGRPRLFNAGHQAVMLFFVLSGYVICYVADTREHSAAVFMVSRLSRLWSVLLPALVLTLVCDTIGRAWAPHPAAYAAVPFDHPAIRLGAMAVFLSESWVSIQPLSNGAAWSLCLEFWYYVMFAAWVFIPPGRLRVAAAAAALLIGGHKAILLAPIWLMGVALQRWQPLRRLPAPAGAALWGGALALVVLTLATHVYNGPIALERDAISPWLWHQLAEARVFWFDWLFGLIVAAHLVGARSVAPWLGLERIARPIRFCAGISFAAYLFHDPLLRLAAACMPNHLFLAIALTLAAIAVLGPAAEHSKAWWRRQLMRLAAKAGFIALPALPGAARPASGIS